MKRKNEHSFICVCMFFGFALRVVAGRFKVRLSERSRETERKISFAIVMLNIPDIVCVYMLGVLAQHDIRKHTAATTTVKLIYVTNTCVNAVAYLLE